MISECPYLPLTERDLEGPALSGEEEQGLHDHLEAGCKLCESAIEEHLSGSGEGEAAQLIRDLDQQMSRAVEVVGAAMDRNRLTVLDRVKRKIDEEGRSLRRRVRRRLQRILFYVVNVAAVFLILAIYMGYRTAIKVKHRETKTMATHTEVVAMNRALKLYWDDRGRLPSEDGLIEALRQERKDGKGSYFPFAEERMTDEGYLDEFGRPYRYRVERNRAVIYSVGADGVDDRGERDDLKDRGWMTFVDR